MERERLVEKRPGLLGDERILALSGLDSLRDLLFPFSAIQIRVAGRASGVVKYRGLGALEQPHTAMEGKL
jgi:hypothetical protein